MKKLLLAATVATLAMNAAQAAPTLYGKLNVTLDQVAHDKFGHGSVTKLNSNASRLGVKGEEKLTDNLSAVYLAEWAISTDGSGSDTDWSARNRFIGLKYANLATLKVGQFDSYFKTAAGSNQDIFNDHTELDMTNVLAGEERLSNVIGLETDKSLLGGLTFNVMLQQGEQADTLETRSANKKLGQNSSRHGLGDGISTSLNYENKDYGLAAAVAGNFGVAAKYNAWNDDLGGKIYSDSIRVTGSLDFTPMGLNGLGLGALWQTSEPTDDTVPDFKGLKEDAYGVTASYAIPETPVKVKAEYISATTERDGFKDRKNDLYGVGIDYNINKQTRFYGVLAQQKQDWRVKNDKKTVVGLGMEYNF